MNGKREFGDYQTPRLFAKKICKYLKESIGLHPEIVIEPTCGRGNFLYESLTFGAQEYYGIEINEEYCQYCRQMLDDPRIQIINKDFFSFSIADYINRHDDILVIGNPPWVTNATLSSAGSINIPDKSNFKKLRGLDAITGCGNFDICEYMILQIIRECKNTNTTVAMLCKTSVARNVYQEAINNGISFSLCKNLEFDAAKVFGINASACLLLIKLCSKSQRDICCEVAKLDEPEKIIKSYSCKNNIFYNEVKEDICDFDGHCCLEWRQGIKHDCSKVVELKLFENRLTNGFKENISIEQTYLYPLVKSSMIKSPVVNSFSRYIIVPQKKVNENTENIAKLAPKTWDYLIQHESCFAQRKSIVYSRCSRFAMFGIGEYSFAPYKVAISGFYKDPKFAVVHKENTPVMLDDTCYFLSFSSYDLAYVAMLLLNDLRVSKFLKNIAFLDSKRPYTKRLLQRIDFSKIISIVSYDKLLSNESVLGLSRHLNISMYKEFVNFIASQNGLFA